MIFRADWPHLYVRQDPCIIPLCYKLTETWTMKVQWKLVAAEFSWNFSKIIQYDYLPNSNIRENRSLGRVPFLYAYLTIATISVQHFEVFGIFWNENVGNLSQNDEIFKKNAILSKICSLLKKDLIFSQIAKKYLLCEVELWQFCSTGSRNPFKAMRGNAHDFRFLNYLLYWQKQGKTQFY